MRLDSKDAACIVHRLDAVQHEVHQHLLDLHAVRTSAGKIVSKIRTDGNSIPHRLTAQHFDHLADDLVQRKRLSFWERLCIERPQTVYDFTGKLPGLDDFVRSFFRLADVGRVVF